MVLGAQWGDEGKGKLVDVLAGRADVVARFNGGANAGHSLVVDGKTYAFHLLPCGMLRADCENVIGNGVVVHLPTLFEELRQLDDGTDASLERLVVSSRAHVLLDAHRVIDGMIEDEKRGRSTGSLGTTKRGVGPAYASKMNRNGLRFCDLVGPDDVLVERLGALRAFQHAHYRGCVPPTLEADDEGSASCGSSATAWPRRACGTRRFLRTASRRTGRSWRGPNAALLDADFGTYPYVTPPPAVGGVCRASACRQPGRLCHRRRQGLHDGGGGPLPDGAGARRRRGPPPRASATSTARRRGGTAVRLARRAAAAYSHAVNGYDSINLTKLDADGPLRLKIGVERADDGEVLLRGYMPASSTSSRAWTCATSSCRAGPRLSPAALFADRPRSSHVRAVEEALGGRISWVGVGPGRDDMFVMPGVH